MKRTIGIVVMAIAAVLNAYCGKATEGKAVDSSAIEGSWHGTLQVGGNKLPLVVHIGSVDGKMEATLDSPSQGAKGIPASISLRNDAVDITVPAIRASYNGIFSGAEIKGTFKQSGMNFPLSLIPGEYIPPRPQTPQQPFPYQTQEVTFVNPLDSAVLSGTLTLPVAYQMPFTKDVPAVIFVTGSGQQNRDEEIYGHKPFAVLAHQLALSGIASLRYDDRGYGQSTGDVENATTTTFAADAQAAVDYLRSAVGKLGRVGVIGHSEGGTIAFMLGASGVVDFVVSLAGPAVSGKEILLTQNKALMDGLISREVINDYANALSAVLDYMAAHPGSKEWTEMDAAIAQFTHLTAEQKANLRQIISMSNPWMVEFVSYDPASDISRVSCPVFAANGTLDMQVDATENLNAISRLLAPNEKSVVKSYPGLNHLFQHASIGHPSEYGAIEETISPELMSDVIEWIKSL